MHIGTVRLRFTCFYNIFAVKTRFELVYTVFLNSLMRFPISPPDPINYTNQIFTALIVKNELLQLITLSITANILKKVNLPVLL
jgi:hypothetical protein